MDNEENKLPIEKEELRERFLDIAEKANNESLKTAKMEDLVNASSPVYKAPPIKRESTIPVKPKIDNEGFPEISGVRTYNADLSDAVSGKNISLSKIALENQEEKRSQQENNTSKSPISRKKIIVVTIFLTIVFVVFGSFYFLKNKKSTVIETPKPEPTETLIRVESESKIALEGKTVNDIALLFETEKNIKIPNDSIKNIIPVVSEESGNKRVIGTFEFFNYLETTIPESLSRSLNPYFMSGLYSDDSPKPFLILITDSYDNAFKGMLDWESKMGSDLAPIFKEKDDVLANFVFKDKIISNLDTRSLENKDGKVMFFYAIYNNNIIIFAKNQKTLDTITNRLRTSTLER